MENGKISILLPSFNGAETIGETLRSLLAQDFTSYEIIVNDDASTDQTEKIVRSFSDPRILFFRNPENRGYPGNLEEARRHARGEIIFLMGQDDILAQGSLRKVWDAFQKNPGIGAVTRPYFWFDEDIKKPVRAKKQLDSEKDEIVRITDDPGRVVAVFDTLDQLSGLAYRSELIDQPFHPDVFTSHIHPFASIFKKHPVLFLKDYSVAVRIRSSQSRKVSSIYEKSPLQSWIEMFRAVYPEKEYSGMREYCLDNFVLRNHVGLLQLKNYAQLRYFIRESWFLVRYRWQNLFSLTFWFFFLGALIMPRRLLILLVDSYKSRINSKKIAGIEFNYELSLEPRIS